jgi:transcriptional regulator with XRE-family HTH domain
MTKFTAMQTFIDNVKRICRDRGMTQSELAEAVGTKQPTVSKVLRGDEEITLSRAEKWATALGVELAELVTSNIFAK